MEGQLKSVYDVVVIGAGPAGLAAGISAFDNGADTLIVERENRPGGILKQCIHDGFGVITFKEKLTGPEYAERFIKEVKNRNISLLTSTYVIRIENLNKGFRIYLVNSKDGVFELQTKAIILSNGCRERTSKQVFIAGTRPAGIYTAGTAQYFVNVLGYLPCKRCVILGSGDIGLIMARRLTLEGAMVIGVYEAKSTTSGLSRNIVQCLEDYEIPLYLSKTITRVLGEDRVTGVEIASVDEAMKPIEGTSEIIDCDGVILSVGLIPENELAEKLHVIMDNNTKGPVVDDSFMTSVKGIFSCGNALHVNDLVDYVTESGILAGEAAARYDYEALVSLEAYVKASYDDFLYVVPQKLNLKANRKTIIYFRSKSEESKVTVELILGDRVLFSKKYGKLKPPEMERIEVSHEAILEILEKGLELKLIMKR